MAAADEGLELTWERYEIRRALETLSPDERAIFVLREVFGFSHDEISEALGKSPAAVRQMAHRAREHVQARRKRFEPVDPTMSSELTARFFAAASTGDLEALMATPLEFTGAAGVQVQALVDRIGELTALYPQAAAYAPGAIL